MHSIASSGNDKLSVTQISKRWRSFAWALESQDPKRHFDVRKDMCGSRDIKRSREMMGFRPGSIDSATSGASIVFAQNGRNTSDSRSK